MIDINDNLDYQNIAITPVEQIPKAYLPSEMSYYDADNYEEYAAKLKIYLKLHLSRIVTFKVSTKPSTVSIAMEPDSQIYNKPNR